MRNLAPLVIALLSVSLLVGCPPKTGPTVNAPAKDYMRTLGPGQYALRKITDPKEIPDFTAACRNTRGLREAVAYSLDYLAKPSSQRYFAPNGQFAHAHAVASLQAFDALLASDLPPEAMNQAIREQFDVYTSVGCDDCGTVLFTGYYTPIFDAALAQGGAFQYPLYRQPAGLQKDDEGNPTTPVGTRGQIESTGVYRGQELAWLTSRVEAYVATVQGSAKLRIDGQLRTAGYAANNGYDYKSVGEKLIADGKIAAVDLSLQTIMKYFHDHPADMDQYFHHNPRYVFFQWIQSEPLGCLNEPVTPWRSIATDKSIYPRACVGFLATKLPWPDPDGIKIEPYEGFVLDQDRGGAIRAPGRCDVYMGVGDAAGELAGRTKQEGRLYYLFLKSGSAAAPAGTHSGQTVAARTSE